VVIEIKRGPCSSCPYRKDVPSGVWEAEEYDKLSAYDGDIMYQPARWFMCHNQDNSLCRGWLDCHGEELLGVRLALAKGELDIDEYKKAMAEDPLVPVFQSGAAAAKHGKKKVKKPTTEAQKQVAKILENRRKNAAIRAKLKILETRRKELEGRTT